MGRSSTVLHALAIAPGVMVSTVLACMVGALLPSWAGLALFVGGVTLMAVLCTGRLEGLAVRLPCRARALREAQAAALAPAVALLCRQRLGPPAITLYVRHRHVAIAAGAVGRRSIVVSGLVQAAQQGHLPPVQAAAVIAHAVGRARMGNTRFDVAVEFWMIPWQLVRGVGLALARAEAWLPLTRFAWKARFVVAAIAVVQSVADGRTAGGLVVAVFIGLTYLSPRWQRAWEQRAQDEGDSLVADHALGDALAEFLKRCPTDARTLRRIHRLSAPTTRPSLALVTTRPAAGR